jgi:DME family drug/metabolite transporter
MFGPIARVALRDGIDPLEIAFWRTVIAAALFAAHAMVLHVRQGGDPPPIRMIRASDLPGLLAFAVIGLAALYAFLPLAVESGGATLAVVLLYTAPAWVALLARPLLSERLTKPMVLAICLTLAGIALIGVTGGEELRPTPTALGWGLASGLAYASLYLFGKRFFARYDPVLVFTAALPIAALVLAPMADFREKTPAAWWAMLALGVLCTYGAYLAYSVGLERLEASRAATIATAEPVVGSLLAWLFWGERLSPGGYVGAAIVLAAVMLSARVPRP